MTTKMNVLERKSHKALRNPAPKFPGSQDAKDSGVDEATILGFT